MIPGRHQGSRYVPRSGFPPRSLDHAPYASSAHGDGMADLAPPISPGFRSPHGGIVRLNDGPVDEACAVVGSHDRRVERRLALDHAVGREFFASMRRPHCVRSSPSFHVRGYGVRGTRGPPVHEPRGLREGAQDAWIRVGRLPPPSSRTAKARGIHTTPLVSPRKANCSGGIPLAPPDL